MKVAKINADWGTDDIRIIVGRNINGITLNGYEYITDNNNFLIGFISEKSARDYLHRHGISDNDIQYLEFFYRTVCPNCGEEVIVKIYDAKIENGFNTIECSNCKTKIKFETEEKEMNENKENIKVLTEDDIIELSNTEKRMKFLNDYQNWGVWLNIEQIKVLRTKSNLMQAQLSEKLGVTSNYISAIETGTRKGPLYFYRDIANYFHVTLDYLFVDSIDIKKNIITDSVILKMSYMEENEQKYILKMVEDFIEYKENNR